MTRLILITGLLLVVTGCPGPATSLDGGFVMSDGGQKLPDGGDPTVDGGRDAGPVYPNNTAGEPCSAEAWDAFDAGLPVNAIPFGMCVALRTLHLTAQLNNQPAVGQVELTFSSAEYSGEVFINADQFGRTDISVMKARYEILGYHPSGVFANHYGYQEFGVIDMNTDLERTLGVTSFPVRGGAFFAGLPFKSTNSPPDITLQTYGDPRVQQISVASQGGFYDLALLAGTQAVYLNTPPEALQGTEFKRYPLTFSLQLDKPTELDINIPGNELEGDIRIDGKSLPDKLPGYDYQLEYVQAGENEPAIFTHHEGGVDGFHSLVPSGKYSVKLTFESGPDPSMPAQLYNKQVSQQVDLTKPAVVQRNFITHPLEGGILIDGQPPPPDPNYAFSLYMYGYANDTDPWFLSYYNVPLTSSSFTLRAFPVIYHVMINLSDHLAPDLVEGWYRIERYLPVTGPTSLPISLETAVYTGKLRIDGEPPPEGVVVGDMIFSNAEGRYTRRIATAKDGEFTVRVPRGRYDVRFFIDRTAYPEYARGQYFVANGLDLTSYYSQDLNYDTTLVTGPLRVGGEVVNDNVGGDDVKVHLRKRLDMTEWEWGLNGGAKDYRLRIPNGDYEMWFEISRGAIPNTAWGTAPMGVHLLVNPYADTGGGTQ